MRAAGAERVHPSIPTPSVQGIRMTGVGAAEPFAVLAAIVVARMSDVRPGGPSLHLEDHASMADETTQPSLGAFGRGLCNPDPTPSRAVLDLTLRDRCSLHHAIDGREQIPSTLTRDWYDLREISSGYNFWATKRSRCVS